jgi:hypothetical protein
VNQITLHACHQKACALQCATATDRAHSRKAKIKSRLIGNLNRDEWDLPPKPKWMRWRTYNRFVRPLRSLPFHGATRALGTSAISSSGRSPRKICAMLPSASATRRNADANRFDLFVLLDEVIVTRNK